MLAFEWPACLVEEGESLVEAMGPDWVLEDRLDRRKGDVPRRMEELSHIPFQIERLNSANVAFIIEVSWSGPPSLQCVLGELELWMAGRVKFGLKA